MIKRIFFITTLVIVLVSLHWFNELFAGDLDDLTPQQKQALLEKLRAGGVGEQQYYYETPPLFDEAGPSGSTEEVSEKSSSTGDAAPNSSETISKKFPDFAALEPFGAELFRGERGNEISIDIASAQDYVLGPGDNIIIYLWGRVEKEYNLTFDREGKVFVPQVGEVIGWGLTLDQFTSRAKSHFSRVYSEFDLTVSLGKIRSIRIFVAGEVKKPGAYTVSSLTSLFNALYMAGGPNGRGSMRQIRLMRSGKPVAEVDLYELLLRGDNSTDVRLQNGDVIFVPVAGPQVVIRGEIKRAARYELKGGEKVLELLSLAGNTTAEAYLERVMLERISQDDEWEVLDLDLDGADGSDVDNVDLLDGDRVTVYSIFDAKKNIVAVFGQVKHAGYYERTDSICVSDLIGRAQLRPFDVYFDRADLFRRFPDRRMEVIPVNVAAIVNGDSDSDILLKDRDSLYVYSIDEVAWQKHVYIEGEVKKPGKYLLYDSMSAEDLIFLAGSFTRSAEKHCLEIARVDQGGEVSIVNVDLTQDDAEQIILQEDDHVYVRQLPEWRHHRAVSVQGEIRYPGEYTLSSRGETLYQLLQRVGGFTDNAFPRGTVVERASIRDGLARLGVSRIIEKSTPLRQDSLGHIVQKHQVEFDNSVMDRLIIDMERILATAGREADIVLEAGDKIFVPCVPSGISVIGAVGSNGTIRFSERQSVKHYIGKAGNFTRQADKKETRLVRATGEVVSGGGILGRRVHLGDVIIVPTKIERDRNWAKTVTTALTAATGVLTSVFIISKL